MAAKSATKTKKWRSRAVTRTVDAGNSAYCAVCEELIKFRARIRADHIICNVYVNNKWDRVEHYHPECYKKAKSPYGAPADCPATKSNLREFGLRTASFGLQLGW